MRARVRARYTLNAMHGKPSERPQHEPGADAPAEPRAPMPERFGPIAIERHLKDDGRALLLYERAGARDA